jgi:lysozyme
MKLSDAGLRLIALYEGLRLEAYPDPGTGGDPWTIGVGTTRYPSGDPVRPGDRITEAQAHEYLLHDVARFEQAVRDAVSVPLTQPQFDSLVSLSYNIGAAAFARSTLVRRLNAGDFAGAAEQFDAWVNAGGKPMEGLRRRRRAERSLFESGAPAPIEARTAPPKPAVALADIPTLAEPVAARMERPMAPILAALLPSVVALIPELGKIFASGSDVSTRNIKAAERVAEIVVAATQAPNLQGAVEAMESSADARNAARLAVKTVWYELIEAGGGGIEGARKHNEAMTSGDGWRAIGYGVTIAVLAMVIVGGGGYMMWALIRDPSTPPDQRGMLIGAIVATISSVVAYFFGSSASSRSKDAALVRELGSR